MNDQHFDYLDGWRGLAILFLLIGHFFPVPGINFGRVGVDFFFVLSGFLMCRLLFIKEVPVKTFYQRRISRIFPAFFSFIIFMLAYFFLTGQAIDWAETSMAGLFLNNYFPGTVGHAVMPFGHIWSLSVEEHTYVFLTLIAVTVRGNYVNAKWALAVSSLISIVLGLAYWRLFPTQKLEFELWAHSEISAYGILFSGCLLLCLQRVKIPTLPVPVYPILILLGLACYWWSMPIPLRGFVGVGLFALTLNILPTAPAMLKRCLSFGPLKKLGLWSFSIYLWQQVFYLAHHREGLPTMAAITLAVICGTASYYLIENPTRRWLNDRWAKTVE
ncbi:acyltransferase [Undibacterium sp. Jales W-56]|uniref:acyltransferase family protein n=1 Tax=Undibacterium sp. Jales W-56 TaxID=2897325 RepID=UPI0021D2F6EC|nr:acyltransferase [Undibacterium sp. Jales W-56]MCU6434128.1 acyltransferase [Undibacterium sp. Jales W-56]